MLVPRGPGRRAVLIVGNLAIAAEVAAQLFLATDVPSAMLYSWLLAAVVPPLVFRWFVPEDVFPVTYGRGGNAAHLDLGGERQVAVIHAMADQLGLEVTKVEPFGLEGSGGSSPLRMTLADGTRVFGKIYSTSHVRADRWYRIGRTILYGQLEDETPIGSVRRLVIMEDYALRFLRDAGITVARTYGIVELTPNQEYMLVTQFFEGSKNLGDSDIDDVAIDEGLQLVRTLWDIGAAHRDVKPANMLIKDGHLQLVDVSGLEIRPSSWRQAVDLANMLLTLALRTDADRVYARATAFFTPDEIAEAFASDVGLAVPTELSSKLKADGRPLRERFKELAPCPTTDLHPALERPSPRPDRAAAVVASSSSPGCSSMPSAPGSRRSRLGLGVAARGVPVQDVPIPGRVPRRARLAEVAMSTTDAPAASERVAVRLEGVVKRFGDVVAVDGVDLDVRRASSSRCSVHRAPARPRACG